MTLAELITEVYALTGREDLVALTTSSVKAATLKAHNTDFYSKDIYEQSFTFITTDYLQVFDYIEAVANYKALKYLRVCDADGNPSQLIEVITPEEVLDLYGKEAVDVCYVAGRVINIKSSTEFNKIIVGCYVFPVVTDAGFSSWAASLYPWAIIHEAARLVFASISSTAEATGQKAFVAEQYALLKINALTDVGS